MSRILKELIREYASDAAGRVAMRAANTLKRSRHTLSGEDSGLTSTWAEICAQVISGEGPFGNAYEAAMRDAVLQHLDGLPERDRVAMWLCTESGWSWHWDVENGDVEELPPTRAQVGDVPVDGDDIVEWILRQHLIPLAENSDNAEVSSYLSGPYDHDGLETAGQRRDDEDEPPSP